jgi:quercetin dioxygenase-like cupin family protein
VKVITKEAECVYAPREKAAGMRRRLTCLVLFSATIAATALYYAGNLRATPAVGFAATTLVQGKFGEIDVLNKSIIPNSSADERRVKHWLSLQKNNGPSDLYVQRNVWQPGGSTGWHTHPGHSLIIVKEGTVTEYEGHDPVCNPHVYTKGMTFLDPGGEHVHIIRNEGDVVAQATAIQLVPAGATRRIDVAAPGNCGF